MIYRVTIWLRVAVFAVAAMLASAAAAQQAPAGFAPPSGFSAQDRDLLRRIETYMNSFTTIRSEFVQMAQGGYSKGRIHLERPGKLRVEYFDELLMVANHGWLNIHDIRRETVSKIPVSSTPLEMLIGENVRFSGPVTVIGMQRGPGSVRVAMVQTEEPDSGMVVLTFGLVPDVALRKWTLVDPQGASFNVAFYDPRFNVAIDSEEFEFRDPNFFNRGNRLTGN